MFYWHVHDDTWEVGATFRTLPLEVSNPSGSQGYWQPEPGSHFVLEFPDHSRSGGEVLEWSAKESVAKVMLDDTTLWRVRKKERDEIWEVVARL